MLIIVGRITKKEKGKEEEKLYKVRWKRVKEKKTLYTSSLKHCKKSVYKIKVEIKAKQAEKQQTPQVGSSHL